LLLLFEFEPPPDEQAEVFPPLDGTTTLTPDEFVHDEELPPELYGARRKFSLAGRAFVAFATARMRPDAHALRPLNDALATLRVERGDFCPGPVEPPRFPARPGWHVGASGPQRVRADGDFLAAWASTVPYRDEPFSVPRMTMEELPPDGIAMTIWLARHNRWPPTLASRDAPVLDPPFGLSDLTWRERAGRLPRDLPIHHLFARVADIYYVEIWLAFGREAPTLQQRREADAMLHELRLPDWGPWERD
ncbi:MAG: hypothetical protein ICV59_06260, partial [Thermoleophilia bacterium]|nr:hypothetical protein [Thermoleophilia bacterium]